VEMAVRELSKTQGTCIYGEGIFKIVQRSDIFINFLVDHVEKLCHLIRE
jgi:hypothetical protein